MSARFKRPCKPNPDKVHQVTSDVRLRAYEADDLELVDDESSANVAAPVSVRIDEAQAPPGGSPAGGAPQPPAMGGAAASGLGGGGPQHRQVLRVAFDDPEGDFMSESD